MSKLLNDLINEVDPHENVHDSISGLCNAIADRIEVSSGNRVRLSDLVSILREDPTALADAVMNNTIEAHAAKMKTRDRATYDAPSPAFDKPRENVKTAEEAKREEDEKLAAEKKAEHPVTP